MKSLKFLAHDNLSHENYPVLSIDFHLGTVLVGFGENGGSLQKNLDGVTLLQFSGFKDRKGIDIYDGDSVQISLSTGRKIKADVKVNDGCFDVMFHEVIHDFANSVFRRRDYLKCYTINHAVEVIDRKSR